MDAELKHTLTDLFPDTLSAQDKQLQTKISGRREYVELTAPRDVKLIPGQPTSYQILSQRLIDITRVLLLFWEPGAGKTGAIGEIAEELRIRSLIEQVDGSFPSPINGAIVIAPNNIVLYEVKRLLFCNHTRGYYQTAKLEAVTKQRQQRRAITEAMSVWYTFTSYGSFLGALQNPERNFARAKIIDPNGNLLPGQLDNFRLACDHKVYFFDEIHHLQQSEGSEAADSRKGYEYNLIRNIREHCTNSIIVLLSGTPAVKDVEELRKIISILAGKDVPEKFNTDRGELTFSQLFEPNNVDLVRELLFDYINGRVSYMVSPSTGVQVQYQGELLNAVYNDNVTSKLKLYLSVMSVMQTRFYLAIRREKTSDVAFKSLIEASNFIYPPRKRAGTNVWEDVIGEGAYATFITNEVGKSKRADQTKTTPKDIWSSPSLMKTFQRGLNPNVPGERAEIILNIARHSAKFGAILHAIEFNIDTLKVLYNNNNITPSNVHELGISNIQVTPGCIYIFFVSVENGLAPFCIALEALGYTRYRNADTAFVTVNREFFPSPCDNRGNAMKKLKPEFKPWVSGAAAGLITANGSPPLQYGVITSKTDNSINQSLKELFNSAENVRGEYCRIIMVSQVGRAGINVFNCQQIHVEPWWDPGIEIQAEKRAMRLDGFDELKKIYLGEIILPVYRHCSQPMDLAELEEALETFRTYRDQDPEYFDTQIEHAERAILLLRDDVINPSERPLKVDQYIYEKAEQRQFKIRQGELLLKRGAMDAWINRPAILNRIEIDKANSVLSAESPPYEPFLPQADKVEDFDYYLRYGASEIEAIKQQLIQGVNNACLFNVGNIETNDKLLARAIDEINNYDKPFDPETKVDTPRSGFYFYPGCLDFDYNNLYLSPVLKAHDGMLSYYRDKLIAIERNSLPKMISNMSAQLDVLINYILSLTSEIEVRDRMTKLGEEQRVQLIEDIILKGTYLTNNVAAFIMTAYRHFIFQIPRPTEIINKLTQARASERSNIANANDILNLYYKLSQDPNAETVIIHNLYWLKERTVKFKEIDKYLNPISLKGEEGQHYRVRILDNNPRIWKDLVQPLSQIYKPILDEVLINTANQYQLPPMISVPGVLEQYALPPNTRVRGTVLPNGSLKLLHNTSKTGQDISSETLSVLHSIMQQLFPAPQVLAMVQNHIRGNNKNIQIKDYSRFIFNLLNANGAIFWMVDWGKHNLTPKDL